MTFELFVDDNAEPVAVFAGQCVFTDVDGDPVVDVRSRTGLWVTPNRLRQLADELEEVVE